MVVPDIDSPYVDEEQTMLENKKPVDAMLLGPSMQDESPYDLVPKDHATPDDLLSKLITGNPAAAGQKKGRDAAYNIDLFSGQEEEVKHGSGSSGYDSAMCDEQAPNPKKSPQSDSGVESGSSSSNSRSGSQSSDDDSDSEMVDEEGGAVKQTDHIEVPLSVI